MSEAVASVVTPMKGVDMKRFAFLAASALAVCLFVLSGCISGGGGNGGLWTIVSFDKYDVSGAWSESVVQEYDEVGRLLSSDWTFADGTRRVYTYDEFDDFGTDTHGTCVRYDANGNVKRTEEKYDVNTYDEQGRLISNEDENGVIYWYSYHDNGVLAESHSNQDYVNRFDERGRKIYYDGGFLSRDGRGAATATYAEDRRGNVTGWTISFENGESYEFACTLDKNGNITDVYGPNGQLLIHAEYVRIANPCGAAKLYTITRAGTWIVMDSAEQWLGV